MKFLVVLTHIMQAMVAMAMAEEAMGEVETWEEVECRRLILFVLAYQIISRRDPSNRFEGQEEFGRPAQWSV